MNRPDLHRSLLHLRLFRNAIARQLVSLAAILTLASCQQSDKHEPPMPTVDKQPDLTYESLSKLVGKKWPLDAEVVNTLLTHPGFRNTPPVTAKYGKSLGEYGDERSDETVEFVV